MLTDNRETGEKMLQVEMFGGFQVLYGGTPVVTRDSRSSKVLLLFQYLLCKRGTMVLQDELIEAILENEESENPAGTLKNLVYRLRKLLESAGVPDCIRYKKGAYGVDGDMPCTVDSEEFMRLVEEAGDPALAEEKRLELSLAAADLYRGGFLPKSSGEPWVMGYSVRFGEAYCRCLTEAYRIVEKMGRYEDILLRLQKAVALYPYEEELVLMYLRSLYETHHVKEALEAYDKVTTVLMDDLGIKPSDRMRRLFQYITSGVQGAAGTAADVLDSMSEGEYSNGAYFCNFEVFTSLYRFVVRYMERSGQSVFLVLCTITEEAGDKEGNRVRKMTENFHGAVQASLRRGDVYTRYSPSQFVLMLMGIRQENCDIVAERLRRHFYKNAGMGKVRLTCKSISAANMDIMMEKGSGRSDEGFGWK